MASAHSSFTALLQKSQVHLATEKLLLKISQLAQAERFWARANYSSASKYQSLLQILAQPTHASSLEMRWTSL
jgi:hypothetical protein